MLRSQKKIKTKESVSSIIDKIKKETPDTKIVFTNGCFDILHEGHVDYLERAGYKGDKMIIGLNSDASIRRLKGSERPINNQRARAKILASLEFVDWVIIFEEDTPLEIIKYLRPDVLIKGKDYDICNIAGAEEVISWGGKVDTIKLVEGISTTEIIRKISS